MSVLGHLSPKQRFDYISPTSSQHRLHSPPSPGTSHHPRPTNTPKMPLRNWLPTCLHNAADCYPSPTATHTEYGGHYIPLAWQPPPPLPMRLLPLALTSADHRTARAIHALLLHCPRRYPDLTDEITTTLSLPREAYTPLLAERLLRAVEETLAADKQETWGWVFRESWEVTAREAQSVMRVTWRVADDHRLGVRAASEGLVRAVRRLVALCMLARMAPGFVRVLGFEAAPVEGERFFVFFLLLLWRRAAGEGGGSVFSRC